MFAPRQATWRQLGGITVGTPRPAGQGWVRIPIRFEAPYWERRAQSLPPKVHRTIAEVDGTRIYLRVILVTGLARKADAPREASCRPSRSGPHEIYYRDPDGTLHRVGTVSLEARSDGTRTSSFRR